MSQPAAPRFAARMVEVQLALMLLTRLPAGRISGEAPSLADAVWAYPLVGALVGGIGAAVLGGALALGLPAAIAAVLAISACVLATGGLHEDGLADLVDGFGGGRDAARKLEIMRDSRIGSYGTLGLILSLMLRVLALSALAQVSPDAAMLALIAIEAAARAGLAVMLRVMPSARAHGLGQSAAGVTDIAMAQSVGLGALMLLLVLGLPGGLIVAVTIALAQAALAVLALRQIGGQTGDVLGAGQQIGALAAWLAVLPLA
jgi:adenosylcobinamide-GDP ribazoletransferase